MTLQILVNHYNENRETVSRFLKSLEAQNYAQFDVIIGSDGGRELSMDELSGYRYKITHGFYPHTGTCHTRNVLLDMSTADYVMFCDIDDEFVDPDGLLSLMQEAETTGADVVGSPFRVEIKTSGGIRCGTIENDIIRVHSKVFKRDFLTENRIRFPDEIETGGDMSFLWLAFALGSVRWIKKNFYTWKWNQESTTRKFPYHDIKTYDRTLKCYTLLAKDLQTRGLSHLYQNLIATVTAMVYLDSVHPRWATAPEDCREIAEKAIRDYLSEFYGYYKTIDESYRRDKFQLMLNFKSASRNPEKFEHMGAWAESKMNKHRKGFVVIGFASDDIVGELDKLKATTNFADWIKFML